RASRSTSGGRCTRPGARCAVRSSTPSTAPSRRWSAARAPGPRGRVGGMEGTFQLGPDDGRLLVRTGRTGLGRRAGHDLTLEATRWTARVEAREPLDASSVEVNVDVDALEVREGTGGALPLSDRDRAEIKKNL